MIYIYIYIPCRLCRPRAGRGAAATDPTLRSLWANGKYGSRGCRGRRGREQRVDLGWKPWTIETIEIMVFFRTNRHLVGGFLPCLMKPEGTLCLKQYCFDMHNFFTIYSGIIGTYFQCEVFISWNSFTRFLIESPDMHNGI